VTEQSPTFISLLAEGYEFRAGKRGDEIWLNLNSPLCGSLERLPLDATTQQLHVSLEVLAQSFVRNEEACKDDPNCCTMDEMLAHQRAKV